MGETENLISRSDVVAAAQTWIGTPYMHQASKAGVGCDCLGLIRGVWRAFAGNEPTTMPNYSADWAEAGGVETLLAAARTWLIEVPVESAKPADVVLFRWRANLPVKHVAILSAHARFIHACEGMPVAEVSLSNWWQRRLVFAFQFPFLSKD